MIELLWWGSFCKVQRNLLSQWPEQAPSLTCGLTGTSSPHPVQTPWTPHTAYYSNWALQKLWKLSVTPSAKQKKQEQQLSILVQIELPGFYYFLTCCQEVFDLFVFFFKWAQHQLTMEPTFSLFCKKSSLSKHLPKCKMVLVSSDSDSYTTETKNYSTFITWISESKWMYHIWIEV